MFQIQWLRRLVRRNTRKIPHHKAINWKQRLSLIYMFCAWNAFGMVVYMCSTGRTDWVREAGYTPDIDIPPARSWAHALGIEKAHVIRMSGFKIDGTYEINEENQYYENILSEHEKKLQEKNSPTQSEESIACDMP